MRFNVFSGACIKYMKKTQYIFLKMVKDFKKSRVKNKKRIEGPNIFKKREILRKRAIQKRNAIADNKKKEIFDKILKSFVNSHYYKDAKIIGAYVGKKESGEFDTIKLLKKILEDDKVLILPRCKKGVVDLDFYQIKDLDEDLEPGAFNLLEPKRKKENQISISKADIIIVPGLLFDIFGNRLGYGKGYYDSALKKIKEKKKENEKEEEKKIITIAFTMDEFILENNDKIPIHEGDIPIDIIITQSRKIDCESNRTKTNEYLN